MNIRSVEYALLKPLVDVMDSDGGLEVEGPDGNDIIIPVIFENEDYKHDKDDHYVRCEKIESELSSVTLTGSLLREDGVMLIDINSLRGIGNIFPNTLEEAVRSHFPVLKEFARGDWNIVVQSISAGNPESVDKFKRQQIEINYLAYSAKGA